MGVDNPHLLKLLKKVMGEAIVPNLFYESNGSCIPKLYRESMKKKKRLVIFMNTGFLKKPK